MGRTLGVVVAHPDDDAYGVAAVVALHLADAEFRFFLVHATDGEGGAIAEGSGATRETLGAVPRVEDANAWRVVGRSPYRHEWFGYPDGGVPDVPFDELVDRVATVLGEERPDVVATFGPDGITGNPDRIRIGEAATAAFLRFAGDGGPGFRRLVYAGIRQSVIDRWNQRRVKAGLTAWDPNTVYHLRGVPDERIDIDIDNHRGGTAGTAGDAGAPHPAERHEQPRGHRGAAGEERLAGDTGDRVAAGPAGPGAHRRLRRPLTAASAAKVSINRDTVGS